MAMCMEVVELYAGTRTLVQSCRTGYTAHETHYTQHKRVKVNRRRAGHRRGKVLGLGGERSITPLHHPLAVRPRSGRTVHTRLRSIERCRSKDDVCVATAAVVVQPVVSAWPPPGPPRVVVVVVSSSSSSISGSSSKSSYSRAATDDEDGIELLL